MSHGHHHLSREEQAKAEIGHTESTPAINIFLTVVLAGIVCAVPVWQAVTEWRAGRRPGFLDVVKLLPTRAEWRALAAADGPGGVFAQLRQTNNRILADIGRYEASLKDDSGLVRSLVPPMQAVITGGLLGGNEDAYCGRDGWLFYRRDVDYVMGRGFLDPRVMARRAAGGNELKAPPQPDPVSAIVDFRNQLAARDIELIVVPVPVKPSIHAERFTARYEGWTRPVQNPSHGEFLQRLRRSNVHVLDPGPAIMAERRPDSCPLYLATDTHWTPSTMERVAGMIADEVRRVAEVADVPPPAYGAVSVSVTNTGDIAAMLKLPAGSALVSPEVVTVRQVRDGATGLWRPDEGADVLLLGDSFANIYSLEPMGWGEAGGLAEHLSLALARPIDALRRNDAGSWATRSMLANELARGHDRLAGKKVVVWEFAARELSAGDWKLIKLKLGTSRPAGFYTPPLGASVTVRGIVRAIAAAPRPGSVPYKDHIVALHIADIASGGAAPGGSQALVYMWSMRDNVWTPAARWLPGQEITLRLRPWADVESRCGAVNRAELADEALVLEMPCWGDE